MQAVATITIPHHCHTLADLCEEAPQACAILADRAALSHCAAAAEAGDYTSPFLAATRIADAVEAAQVNGRPVKAQP